MKIKEEDSLEESPPYSFMKYKIGSNIWKNRIKNLIKKEIKSIKKNQNLERKKTNNITKKVKDINQNSFNVVQKSIPNYNKKK